MPHAPDQMVLGCSRCAVLCTVDLIARLAAGCPIPEISQRLYLR